MSHYFDPAPSVGSRPGSVRLRLPDMDVELATDRGVFSGSAVDTGTIELLRSLRLPDPGGAVLDLGCGYGPIAVALARRWPGTEVWAVDVNERALALTRRNAEAVGAGNLRAARPDEVPSELMFREIWSNPPIRIGKAALHALLLHWLGRLEPGGVARLVVQRNLGSDSLAAWLDGQGWAAARVSSRKGYRILEVRSR